MQGASERASGWPAQPIHIPFEVDCIQFLPIVRRFHSGQESDAIMREREISERRQLEDPKRRGEKEIVTQIDFVEIRGEMRWRMKRKA